MRPAGQLRWLPLLLALAFHLPALTCDFVYDDVFLVAEHPYLSSPSFVRQLWTRDYGLEFSKDARGFYRPAFMTLNWLLFQIAGPHPLAYHAFSLLVFCIATWLVVRTTRAVCPGAPDWVSIMAGCLYAVHPARVETVSLFMSLPDLMVEVLALLLVLRLVRPDTAAKPGRLHGVWLCGVLALLAALSKENSFLLLSALSATTFIRGMVLPGAGGVRVRMRAFSMVLALTVAMGLRAMAGVTSPTDLVWTLGELAGPKSGAALYNACAAVREILVPGPVVFWRYPAVTGGALLLGFMALYLAVLAAFWLYLLVRGRFAYALLTAWFGASIVTVMLLSADRYPYSQRYVAVAPAMIGLCLLAWMVSLRFTLPRVAALRQDRGRRLIVLLSAAYVAVHGAHTLAGSAVCLTPVSFFVALSEANPSAMVPLVAVVETLDRGGRVERMEAYVRQATTLDPAHAQVTALHNLLIRRYIREGRYADAARCADWALGVFPGNADKLALKAAALAYQGSLDEAARCIQTALEKEPANTGFIRLRDQIESNRAARPAGNAP